MISINKAYLSFGEQTIFNSISGNINEHDHIGLTGRNGSGKSTLLKAIAGQQHLDDGSITVVGTKTIAYLPQEVVLNSDKSIIDETCSAYEEVFDLVQEKQLLENRLEHNHDDDELLERYAHVNHELLHVQPETIRTQAQQILSGLGFKAQEMNKPISELSVGWKMRIMLAKLLLKNADFYLFDEPTNHLDIVAKNWFLHFLQHASFGFMLVCHDRYFLDHACHKILDLENGSATFYSGNYSTAIKQKEQALKHLHTAYEQQQREIKRKMATINRFRASATKAKAAQSMLKEVEKIECIELPPSLADIKIKLPEIKQPGKIVLNVRNVGHAFDSKQIFNHVNFEIKRGEKVALIAANGVGKTTLLNIIMGKLLIQTGTITLGHNVTATVFAQDQTKELDKNKSIIDNICQDCPHKPLPLIRSLLGAFLFSGDDIYKKVNVLSGGEKNRVGMVRTLLQDANLLLLDEPTNHLDIPSKEILLRALQQSQATILFVSHDQDFVNHLATSIIKLTPTHAHTYEGNYEAYLYHKAQLENSQHASTTSSKKSVSKTEPQDDEPTSYEQKKLVKKLERQIDKLEREIKQVENQFAHLEYGTQEFNQNQTRLINLKKKLDHAFTQWADVQ